MSMPHPTQLYATDTGLLVIDVQEKLMPFIRDAAALYQMPEAFIRAIIKVESDYDPKVGSCAGARGLMQIMPSVERSGVKSNCKSAALA